MSEYKCGDRVRVKEFEGVVKEVWGSGRVAIDAPLEGYDILRPERCEKIEPPVVTFGPGQVVRSKCSPGTVLALSNTGYLYVGATNNGFHSNYYGAFSRHRLNSSEWDVVEL